MKAVYIISQAVGHQMALLPRPQQMQYANLLKATHAFPEQRLAWLVFVYSYLNDHFLNGTALAFPPYLRNNRMIDPPASKMQLQEVLYNIKSVSLEMRDLYTAVGKNVAIQLAVQIIGRENPSEITILGKQLLEDSASSVKDDEKAQFVRHLEAKNTELQAQLVYLRAENYKKQTKIYDIEHIEQLYRLYMKRHAAHQALYEKEHAFPTQNLTFESQNGTVGEQEREFRDEIAEQLYEKSAEVEELRAYINRLAQDLELAKNEATQRELANRELAQENDYLKYSIEQCQANVDHLTAYLEGTSYKDYQIYSLQEENERNALLREQDYAKIADLDAYLKVLYARELVTLTPGSAPTYDAFIDEKQKKEVQVTNERYELAQASSSLKESIQSGAEHAFDAEKSPRRDSDQLKPQESEENGFDKCAGLKQYIEAAVITQDEKPSQQ